MSARQSRSRKMSNRIWPRLLNLEGRVVPSIATWDGGGPNANWTTAANWVGDVAPMPGDNLVFPGGTQQLSNANDFPIGTAFGTITVTGLNYVLSGNAMSLSSLTANLPAGAGSDTDLQASFGVVMNGMPLTISVGARVVNFSGPLTGAGGLIKNGTGALVLSGANTYKGATTVAAGVLQVRSDTALGATGAGNETKVADGATLALAGDGLVIAEPVFFTGRGFDGVTGAIAEVTGNNTLSGPLTLTGNALIDGPVSTTASAPNPKLTITAGIGEVGGPHDLQVDFFNVPAVTFAASAVNTFTGRLTITGNVIFNGSNTGPVTVAGGLVNSLTGTFGPTNVSSGGISAFIGFGGVGLNNTSGVLTFGDLNLTGGNTQFVLGHTVASPFVVHGSVHLAGGLVLYRETDAKGNSFQIKSGDTFTLIDNDGSDPVAGSFNGLPEGAVRPVFVPPGQVGTFPPVGVKISYHGGDGNDVTLTGVTLPASAAAAGPGGEPRVNIYDGGGSLMRSFLAYPAAFRGGVHVATGDITGDGVPDVVTGAGPGGSPLVRVWDGVTGAMVREFYAYDPNFTGGVFVAAADLNLSGYADVITGPGFGGGPHVKIFLGLNFNLVNEFFAYDPAFRGGVSVAATQGTRGAHGPEVFASVITGAGPSGGPHVKVFSHSTFGFINLESEFFAYDPAFRGGVAVAAGRSSFPGLDANIVTAPMSGGGPDVRVYNTLGQLRANFFAYDPAFTGGVSVAVLPVGSNGANAILTGAGPGGGPLVRQWEFPGPAKSHEFFAFDPAFRGGVFVG